MHCRECTAANVLAFFNKPDFDGASFPYAAAVACVLSWLGLAIINLTEIVDRAMFETNEHLKSLRLKNIPPVK